MAVISNLWLPCFRGHMHVTVILTSALKCTSNLTSFTLMSLLVQPQKLTKYHAHLPWCTKSSRPQAKA